MIPGLFLLLLLLPLPLPVVHQTTRHKIGGPVGAQFEYNPGDDGEDIPFRMWLERHQELKDLDSYADSMIGEWMS